MKYILLLFTSILWPQQHATVHFKNISGKLTLNPAEKSISGQATYTFVVLQHTDTLKIDAQNMAFSNLQLNKKTVPFINTSKQIQVIFPLKKGTHTLTFNYTAQPKQALYFVGSPQKNNLQIWTQGQGRYTSNWFPSFDDVNQKAIFDLEISFDPAYQVISNGILKSKTTNNNTLSWHYSMNKPMSSYLLMLAIGKYNKTNIKSKSGIPLELYLEPENTAKQEPTYRYSQRIFDFLEKEIGVPYPWQIYRQIPVRDFLYAGMENTTTTLFASRYVTDSIGFEDRSYTNVNAHELAHHWFGNLITAKNGTHHWLQEGFATYYALLAEKKLYGADYFYSKLYESAQQIKFASRTDPNPVLNAKASSLSFYQKGAWALFVLHEKLGDVLFKKIVKNYLQKNAFKNVVTADFFNEIKKYTAFDTEKFSKIWLESTVFDTETANELLRKNKAMQILLQVVDQKSKPLAEKKDLFEKIMQSEVYFSVKETIINQISTEKIVNQIPFLQLALNSKQLQLRQAVAHTLGKIPASFKPEYETLLYDKSYQTQEIALFNLWNNFPESQILYLERSRNWIGFSDYNLRILWLSLALATPNYLENKQKEIDELTYYSSSNFESGTRQEALEKLLYFNLISDAVLQNLAEATTHSAWQFAKFARESIRTTLKNPKQQQAFERLMPLLKEPEQVQLKKLLKELD